MQKFFVNVSFTEIDSGWTGDFPTAVHAATMDEADALAMAECAKSNGLRGRIQWSVFTEAVTKNGFDGWD